MAKYWIVAFEFPPFPGGQATYAYEMASTLRKMGNDVAVVVPNYKELNDTNRYDFEIHRVFEHQILNLSAYSAFFPIARNIQSIDVVLCCDIRAGLLLTGMPWVSARKILMFHGGEILHSETSKLSQAINYLATLGKDKLVANSKFSASLVKRFLKKKCQAIPLGVSDYWKESPFSSFENAELNSLLGKKVIFLAARIEKRKGHLEAFDLLLSSSEFRKGDAVFAFSGKNVDAEHMAKVKKYCEDYPDLFVYLGVLSKNDVKKFYSISRFLLLMATHEPKHIEGFGLVILEAAAQGCPCIVSNVGGIPDAVDDGRSGVILSVDDRPAAIKKIDQMLADDEFRNALSKGALENSKYMSWEKVVKETFISDF